MHVQTLVQQSRVAFTRHEQSDIQEAKEEGQRILIDEDGAASVNLYSREVQADFARHVMPLCNADTREIR